MQLCRRIVVLLTIGLFVGVNIGSNIGENNYQAQQTVENTISHMNSNILFETGFEEPWEFDQNGDYLAPPGWDVDGISTTHHKDDDKLTHYWSQMTKNFSYTHNYFSYCELDSPFVHNGQHAAVVWRKNGEDSTSVQSDEWMITPALDFSDPALYDITLEFWSIFVPTQTITMPFPYTFQVNNSYNIEITDNYGFTWDTVADLREKCYCYGVSEFDVYSKFSEPIKINLDSYREKENVKIGWHYYWDGEGINDIWVVDDVRISAKYDTVNPRIDFKKPEQHFIYFDDTKIHREIGNTIVLGDITVEADIKDDQTDIEKVEFYVDGKLKEVLTSKPYIWEWNEFSFRKHTLSIKAYDDAGNVEIEEMNVLKLF